MSAKSVQTPQGCTNFKIRQLMRQMSQHYDAEIGKTGLRATQYALLRHVYTLGPIRAGELAQAMRLDASTLTRNLKPLVDAGWLRIEAGSDGRNRLVALTDTGRIKRDQAKAHWKAAQEELNRILGVDKVLALHALIDEALESMAGSGPDAGKAHRQ
jgi:DNA-binding MarR family transcriptional regulator